MFKKMCLGVYDAVCFVLILCGLAHMEMSEKTEDTMFN